MIFFAKSVSYEGVYQTSTSLPLLFLGWFVLNHPLYFQLVDSLIGRKQWFHEQQHLPPTNIPSFGAQII